MSEQLTVTPSPVSRKRKVGAPPTLPAPTNLVEARLFCGEVASRKNFRPSQVKAATVVLESFERAAEKEIERLKQEVEAVKVAPTSTSAGSDSVIDAIEEFRRRQVVDLKSENESLKQANLRLVTDNANSQARIDRMLKMLQLKSNRLWADVRDALAADDLEAATQAKSDVEVCAEILKEGGGCA